jgi:peptide/nickel transport system substrate-binding protein
MDEIEYWARLHNAGRIGRREFLGRSAAAGAGIVMLGQLAASADAYAAETPRKGGVMRMGIGGGSTTDSLDPTSWNDSVPINAGNAFLGALIEVGADMKPIPELAESWESKPGAVEWIFNLRRGVTFHNGKTFTADDAIYSINLHRGKTKSGAAGSFKAIADVKKLGDYQISITLNSADAEFPMVLTDYHNRVVPDGTTDFSKGIGTNAFVLESYDAGVRVRGKKFANFWRTDRGYLDGFDITVINDSSARMNALISGQVDVVNRVDPKIAGLIKAKKNLSIVQSNGTWHSVVSLMQDKGALFENLDLRLAMKYGIDRTQIVKTLFGGYGSVGNDTPISRQDPYYNPNIPQATFDVDKAKFHLKKSGFDGEVTIQASDAAFNGAVDMATLMQSTLGKTGLKVTVKKEAADGFWSNVWLKGACVTSYWGGRSTATQMLDVGYGPNAPWNESHFRDPKFGMLLDAARSELNQAKRKEILFEAQAIMSAQVATLVPAFRDYIDAHQDNVGGHTPHGLFDLDNTLLTQKGWMKA